jgi:tetratricopeptide (TPR) repeat protein
MSNNSQQAHDHFERGNQFFDNGDFKGAISEWRTTLQLAPHFENARYNLGLAYAQDGQTELAIQEFDAVIDHDAFDVDARYELANLFLKADRLLDAVEEINGILKIAPSEAKAQQLLGELNEKQHSEAVEFFERGIRFYDQKNSDRAIEEWEQALELDPDFTNVHFNLGLAYSDVEEYDLAIQEFRKVLRLQPNDLNARHELAEIYFDTDKTDLAIQELQLALLSAPNDTLAREILAENDVELAPEQENAIAAEEHYRRGNAFDEQDDSRRAIAEWRAALELNPDHAGAHYNLGIAYADEEDWDAAIFELKTATELAPLDPDASYELAEIYFELGELDHAENELRHALNLNPSQAQAAHLLAEIYIQKEKWDHAVAALEQSTMLEDDADLWITVGRAYEQSDRVEDAVLAYRRALIANPQSAQAQRALLDLGAPLEEPSDES